MKCIFVTDIHGSEKRFDILFKTIKKEKPDWVFFYRRRFASQSIIN